MPNQARINAYSDPQKLRAFFGEKGHPYLVLHTPDVMQMLQSDQILYLSVLRKIVGWDDYENLSLERRIQRSGFRGYVRVPIDEMCEKLTIEELIEWQGWIGAYREVRQGKYEPTKIDKCDCTTHSSNKNGAPNPKCNKCEGKGVLTVLMEVSEIEIALAEGKKWEEIDTGGSGQ